MLEFVPPRCPNRSCRHHRRPTRRFFVRNGTYRVACRDEPVPRFRCIHCGKGFSRQTFRHDYYDRRPDLNDLLINLLASGMGLRQSARVTGLTPSSVQWKMRKIGRTCRWLHRNLSAKLPAGRTWLLDEEESYEGASIRTLSIPVVMERESWFVAAIGVAATRRLAARGTKRRDWQDHVERRDGPRRDRSNLAVRVALGRLRQQLEPGPLILRTDEKASYKPAARDIFGARVLHETTLGTLARTTANPLFSINTLMAMTRDNCGRLRRKSWLVSKRARYLRRQLQIFTVYRNYVRKRFNRDKSKLFSSAVALGILLRALKFSEVLAWRQDWREHSVSPFSFRAERSVAESLQPTV